MDSLVAVDMAVDPVDQVDGATWRKSACSGTNGNCVEVARTADGVAVRDTADRVGGMLRVPAAEWHRFTASLS
jgi:hypothetical protein